MLGIFIRKNEDKNFFTIGAVLAIGGFLLQIVEASFFHKFHGGGLGIKLSSFIFSAGVVLMLVSRKRAERFTHSKVSHVLAWIGEVSFGVYLAHMYSFIIVAKIVGDKPWGIFWFSVLAFTLALIWIAKRILPSKFTYKYLGF